MSVVIETEEWIETYTIDTILYSKTWKPSEKTVATIVFVHGLGEHIQRYQEMFTHFAQNGIKVVGFDQRGFGRTAEQTNTQGKSEGLEKTLEDILYISKEAKEPGVKHFVMGHSMGGAIALEFARRYQGEIDGVISSAPAISPGMEARPNAIQLWLVWFFLLVWPSLVMKTYLQTNTLTRDEEKRQDHHTDPLNHGYLSVLLASELLELSPRLMESAHEFKRPVYISHGSGDKMTCPIASRQFFNKLTISDKKYADYTGFYHELHNEPVPDRHRVFRDYVDWILAHQ
jgi:acylglycerol lipase